LKDIEERLPSEERTNGAITLVILASIVLILTTTLFPFNFALRGSILSWNTLALPRGTEGKWEILINIALYVPLGLGITAYFYSKGLQIQTILIVALVACFTISYFCEVLQFFLPSRFPSWRDVTSNTMGGALGSFCLCVWAHKLSRSSCLTN
jgi:glycopeptide antibiotics resistance protein